MLHVIIIELLKFCPSYMDYGFVSTLISTINFMTMDFDDLSVLFSKQNYVTKTKLKKLNDKNVKQVLSHLILKISFLTIFVCGVKITPDINPIYCLMDRPCPNDSKNL